MADNQYKILLGTKLDTSDIQDQVTAASKSIKPIELKIDAETKELTNTIKEALNTLSKGTKNALTLDTSKLEASLNDVTSTIREIKTAIGTLDSGSNMKSLVSSINQISTALDKASNKFDGLIGDLKALSGKDFSLNFGINLGGSNSVARQGVYGSHVRSETLPELKKQAKALQDYFKEYYNVQDELSAIMKLAPNRGGDIVDLYSPMSGYKSKTEKESLSKQMGAYREYINIIREAASLRGIDISHITSSFSKSADQLVQDAQDIQTGAKEMDESFDKLKQIFGGGNNISIEGLSASLEPIVADLNQIREAVVNLSKGVSLEGLTQSFNRLSDTIEKLVSNVTLAKNALGNGLGSVASTAVPTINLDDVIDEQAMKLMNEYAITGSKAFDEIRQSLVDFKNGTGDINKVTSAISNNMKVINDAKDDYRELAEYIKMFNASGAKVHIPDSIRQEYGDDYKSMRSQLGKGFTSGKGMDFETFVEETNEILGQTIDLSHGAEAAFGDLVDKVNSAKGGKFLTGDDLFKNGILDMGDVVANVSTSLEQIEKAEEEVARTSTSVANTVVQNEERTTNAYQETSGVIENLKAALQTMKLDRSSIDAVIKDVEELGFTAKDASVAMKNGDFDITVNGVDNIGRAITEIRHLDSATGEITGISRKISQSLTETDKFVKQQKRAVTDLTNQINQLNRAATDQNANRPIKDTSHLDALENKYQEIIAAIQKMGNASSATFDDERNEVKRLISEYKSLKSEFKNAENVSMDFKGADFASGLEIAKNRLREFKADAKGFSQVTHTVEELDRAIEGVGDKSSLDKFNDQLRVAKSELKAVKAEVLSNNDNLAAKIRIDIETEKFENKVSQLHTQLDQLTDVDGSLDKLRASIKQVDDAYEAMTKATDDESLIQAQKRFAAAVEKTNNELKIQTREQRAANNAAKLADSRVALKTDMLNWLQKNSKAAKEYKSEIDRLIASLDKLDQAGVNGVRRQFKNIDRDAELKGLKGLNFLDSMKSKIKEYSVYFGAAEMFMYAEQGLRDMFEQVKLIDSAMTELKKVTNETDAAYNKFLTDAADRAKAIGTTIDGLVSSTADFARLGYSMSDAANLAEVANIYSVVGDDIDSVETATESLISTMTAFGVEASNSMNIVDKFNAVGNNFAISSGGIGEALERSASSMAAANNSLDETIALITAANTVVQDPEAVGTAFKTISMRIRGAKTELEEMGEDTTGMASSTAKLREEIMALSGVDIMLDNTTFKSTYKIMEELAAKWQDLTDIQQASVTELIAGKRQGNIVSSLMTNFDIAQNALQTSIGSSGSAMEEHAKAMDSIELKLNTLKAAWQSFAQTFMDSDTLKVGIDTLRGLVETLDWLVDNFGLLGTIGLSTGVTSIFKYFKGAKEAKKNIADVVASVENLTEVVKNGANATNAATDANLKNAASEVTEAEASTVSAAAEEIEARANLASVATETAEVKANAASTASELAESEANTASAASELAETMGSAASAAAETAEAAANLGGAVATAGAGATKAAGGFAAFATSTAGVVAGVGILIAILGVVYNQYKKAKEAAAEARQEAIAASDEYLDAASSFEKAYIKYSDKTDLTTEEESELESAIQGTVDALGQKDSALQSAVNSSNDYVASLEAIKKAELEAAKTAAEEKRQNAEESLRETAIGWLSGDGSEVDILLDNASKEVIDVAEKMGSKFYNSYEEFVAGGRGYKATYHEIKLSGEADTNEIIEYYNFLKSYQKELEAAELTDTSAYRQVNNAIEKLSESIGVYTDSVYEAVKAEYQLAAGIPKTTEEYVAMREAILTDNRLDSYSVNQKMAVANALDSNYAQLFDLSAAEVQARKFVGIIKGYGNGINDGTDEIGTVETFLNMRTAVNNNECSVGEYLAQFDEIDKMTANWSDEDKELLNTSFGLDTDTIKAQYDDMEKYLARKINLPVGDEYWTLQQGLEDIHNFLDGLSADELDAVIDIRTEIDWENTSAEDIRKQIEDQVKLNEALNFNTSIEVDKTALEALNTVLEESASAMGLSEESIDSLKSKYAELEGYNPHTLFEKTANGVKVNREELAKLEKKYNDLTKTEVQEHLDTLVDEYNKCTKAIDGNIDSNEKLELINKREKYAKQIEELAEYQAQLEGVTGAYERWLKAQETPEDYEGYEKVATSREDIKDEISRGFLSNSTKEYIDLLSGKDLVGGSIDDYYNAWKKLDDKVGSTNYSINDFFTVNDDGDITSTGIDRFFKGIQKDFNGSVAEFDKETGEWQYNFSQENLQKIQDEWGIGIEAIELLLEAAASAGYDVDWGGMFDDLDIDMSNFESVEAMISLAEKAQEEFNKIKGVEDVEFNFRANNIEEATTEVEKARKAYLDLITNKDGSINLKAEGAEQMQFMLSTLLTQKQRLSTPAIMKVDTSQIDKAETDIIDVINKAKALQTAYEKYEIAITTGVDVEGAKKDLNSAIEGMKGTSVDVRADLKLPSNDELEAAKNGIGDIKIGASLDDTSIGAIATKIQTECTPKVIAKVTGLDETAIQDGSQQVVYTAEHSDVDAFIDSLTDISKKIIYKYTTEGTKPNPSNINRSITYKYKTEGDIPEVNGTANANGTANSGRAFARGNWGIKGSGTALVGELGMETLVRGSRFYTIGDNGAEFIKYKQGDIIFNHKQTEELFKNGKVTSDGGRGRMFANGSAYAEGTALWQATASGSNFASNRTSKDGDSSPKVTKTTNKKANPIKKNNISVNTTITTTDDSTSVKTSANYSANVNESNFAKQNQNKTSKDDGNKKDDGSKFEDVIDWIENLLDRTERAVDKYEKQANNIYNTWSKRNKALENEIAEVDTLLELYEEARDKYLSEANSVGLPANYATKVRNGSLSIEDFEGESDEKLVEKIKNYQDLYNKYLDCIDKIDELKEQEASLYSQRFDHVSEEYENLLQGFDHTQSMLDEYINQAEAKGYIISKNYYNALIDNEENRISKLKQEQFALIKARDEAVANDEFDKYSEDWYRMCSEIDEVTQSIEAATTATIEWSNEIRNIDWSIFDLIQERISDITEEADFLIDLMSYDKLFDDNGKLTDKGLATMGLHTQNMNTYMYQADDYGKEIAELDKQLAKAYDGNVAERRQELLELQRESILAAEQEKDVIKDLISEAYDAELDALQDLIDKKTEALESERDLYNYQKQVKEQTEEIASLEKQRAAYLNDDSESGRAKLQEITVSLKEAKQDLEETEYDKFISDQSTLLDELYLEYENVLNTRLDDISGLISDVINEVNNSASTIGSTLTTAATDVGAQLSAAMSSIWSGEGSGKAVVDLYGEDFQKKLTTTNLALDSIKNNVIAMVDDIDKDATAKTTANKTTTSAKKDPTKTATTTTNTNKNTTTNNNSSNASKITDDTIKGIAAAIWIYGKNSGWGNNPFRENKLSNKIGVSNAKKVQDYINKYGANGALYNFWVSKGKNLDSYKYNAFATGAKLIDETQLAWTQEQGQEYIVRPSDGAILTPVAKGDSVLTSAASNNIWDMANSPAEFIKDNLNLGVANAPNNSTVQSSYTQILDKVVFNLPNVKNYDELLVALQKDPKFDKLIKAMTIDQIAGRSSLAKNKSIR